MTRAEGETTNRESLVFYCKTLLNECRRRRRDSVSVNFYWVLFEWAQNARKRVPPLPTLQKEMFQ